MSHAATVDRAQAFRLAGIPYQTGVGWINRGLFGPQPPAAYSPIDVTALGICRYMTCRRGVFKQLRAVAEFLSGFDDGTLREWFAVGKRVLVVEVFSCSVRLVKEDDVIRSPGAQAVQFVVVNLEAAYGRVCDAMASTKEAVG